jgi:hypothetical protein
MLFDYQNAIKEVSAPKLEAFRNHQFIAPTNATLKKQ